MTEPQREQFATIIAKVPITHMDRVTPSFANWYVAARDDETGEMYNLLALVAQADDQPVGSERAYPPDEVFVAVVGKATKANAGTVTALCADWNVAVDKDGVLFPALQAEMRRLTPSTPYRSQP